MRILVTFALEAEFAPWRRIRRFTRESAAGTIVHTSRMNDSELRVVLTGVGMESARRAMRWALDDRPDACLSSGLAGGLKRTYRPGDVLVARSVGGGGHGQAYECDSRLVQLASSRGAKVVERFWSADRIVVAVREKSQMAAHADAVEMEGFAVLAEANARGVPAVAVRAISDPAEMDLPFDFNVALTQQGRLSVPRVVGEMAKHPLRTPALARFGWRSRRAAAKLARFLDEYVQALASRAKPSAAVEQVAVG